MEQQASAPQLCEKGCGFFSNVGCGGMCSKCHREIARQQAEQHANATPSKAKEPLVKPTQEAQPQQATSSQPSPAAAEASTSAPSDASAPSTKCTTRCLACKKKVGLTGFKCKCGDIFCGQHRHAESHDCQFDYKGMHKEKLTTSNPVVQASKVQKI